MSEARAYKPRVTVVPATKNRFTAMPIANARRRRMAAYARVSTNSDEQKTSYEAQVSYYTDYILRAGGKPLHFRKQQMGHPKAFSEWEHRRGQQARPRLSL